VETLGNEKVWNGISSAGVTASWDGELAEVSDDSPTFANPQITVYKAQAFVQASIEATQDIAGLEGSLLALFADARDRLEGAAHCTGSGTNQPVGIFTALDASSPSVEIVSTTAATIGEVDLAAIYDGVPVRHRGNGKFLMNPIWDLAIRRLGTAVSYSYSGDLTQGLGQAIYGKPVVLSDDAPEVATTTALDQRIVFGNFDNYVIVDKPGSGVIEYIPHLFNTSNNLPDGRRGWYFAWRSGADSVNDAAFTLLMDKTSA
jgi:HK97 family phage major capsid protein